MANSGTDVEWLTSKLQSTTLPKESGVSFAGKGLKLNDAKDAQAIIEKINSAEKVEFLNMEGNSLGVEAAEEIGKALGNKKEFRKALWKDMFTSRLKNEIPIALKHLGDGLMLAGAKLEILDLSDNASGPIGVEGFEELLRSPSCYTLRELRLNNMGLGVTGAKKLASALLDLYNNSKNAGEPLKLEVFIAGRNRLENPGSTALAQVFQKIGTLKEISIPQNGIYHAGIAALSAAFNENLSLEIINLNDNTVTEKGAKSLSKVLCKLNNLKSLDLGDCLLRSEGATAIAESLSSLRHLETVNLSFNEIKGTAGSQVLQPLGPISSLTSINLDGNMFGPQVSEELVSLAKDLKLPLGSLEEDEGDQGDDDEDYEQVDEEEGDDDDDDEYGDEEEEEDAEDTESDQPYNIDDDYEEETDGEPTVVFNSGVSPLRSAIKPQPLLQQGSLVLNFLNSPTVKNFLSIPEPKVETILQDINTRKENIESCCDEVIRCIVAVGGLHASSDFQIKESVMRTCIALFQEITVLAEKNKAAHILSNRIPVHFGFIKDEDTNKKKVVPERDSCLRVLHAAISSKCLPQQTINIITSIEACIKV